MHPKKIHCDAFKKIMFHKLFINPFEITKTQETIACRNHFALKTMRETNFYQACHRNLHPSDDSDFPAKMHNEGLKCR